MAFVLTPRFVPAYHAPQCGPFGFGAPARPAYRYRVACAPPRRPQYSSFNHFFSQVDELLSEIDRHAQLEAAVEAQRAAHRQRQQRKRALRAQFAVNQDEQGWQVNGDIQGFEQHHINIEVTDEHTLKIAGNTKWQSEETLAQTEIAPAAEEPTKEVTEDKIDGATLNEAETESATVGPDSDTESHKSYQATVEDDFEDLTAETASLISASSASSTISEPTEPKEPKGKEKAVEQSATTETAATQQPQEQTSAQQEPERVHGSFERTFRFPERIDGANVRASFKDGTLNITVPRAPAQEVKRIAIQ